MKCQTSEVLCTPDDLVKCKRVSVILGKMALEALHPSPERALVLGDIQVLLRVISRLERVVK